MAENKTNAKLERETTSMCVCVCAEWWSLRALMIKHCRISYEFTLNSLVRLSHRRGDCESERARDARVCVCVCDVSARVYEMHSLWVHHCARARCTTQFHSRAHFY